MINDPLYIYDEPTHGPMAVCEDCYDNGNSGHEMRELDRRSDESLDIDRLCWFCGKFA